MKVQERDSGREGWSPTRDELNEWLRGQVLCTLSTLDRTGAPESATVAFSVTETGELLIGTSALSHKSQNVDRDERVAVVVTDSDERLTAQIQGSARKLAQKVFELSYADEHYRQRPESLPFKDEPGQCHILVTPSYAKFSDASVHPWLITEFDSH